MLTAESTFNAQLEKMQVQLHLLLSLLTAFERFSFSLAANASLSSHISLSDGSRLPLIGCKNIFCGQMCLINFFLTLLIAVGTYLINNDEECRQSVRSALQVGYRLIGKNICWWGFIIGQQVEAKFNLWFINRRHSQWVSQWEIHRRSVGQCHIHAIAQLNTLGCLHHHESR